MEGRGHSPSLLGISMTAPNLGKIERVPDLRATWPNEAQHFTPWLAENIAALGEALGMDLELQQTEAPVGGYSLDILATDLGSRRPVIIENQLEITDHPHLGQLITYASGFDADVVVWVTREFRDEHRQALDWLNQRTGEDTQFFGVEVELWKIGDSLPAPHFNLVATPNGWRKATKTAIADPPAVSERGERQRKFYQELIDALRENHKFTGARKALPQSWYSFATGYREFKYWASFTWDLDARIDLRIEAGERDNNIALLEILEQSKEQIEYDFGHPLEWDRMEGNRGCRIAISRPGKIEDDDATLSEIRSWMVENLLKLRQIFGPRLAELTYQQN